MSNKTVSVRRLHQIVNYVMDLKASIDKEYTGMLIHCYKVRSNWALFVVYGYLMKQFYWSLDKCKAYFDVYLRRFNNLTEDNLSYLLEYELILRRDMKLEFTD